MRNAISTLLLASLAVGCGGGGTGFNPLGGTGGRAVISFEWPQQSRIIPQGTDRVYVRWFIEGMANPPVLPDRLIVRGTSQTQTETFTGLPEVDGRDAVKLKVQVEARKGNVVLATATESVNTFAGETTEVIVSLKSTISKILAEATLDGISASGTQTSNFKLPLTGRSTFQLSARSAANAVVPVSWGHVKVSATGDIRLVSGSNLVTELTTLTNGSLGVVALSPEGGSLIVSSTDVGFNGDPNFLPEVIPVQAQSISIAQVGGGTPVGPSNLLRDIALTSRGGNQIAYGAVDRNPKDWVVNQLMTGGSNLQTNETNFPIGANTRLALDGSAVYLGNVGANSVTRGATPLNLNGDTLADLTQLGSTAFALGQNGRMFQLGTTVSDAGTLTGTNYSKFAMANAGWGANQTAVYAFDGNQVVTLRGGNQTNHLGVTGLIDIAATNNLLFTLSTAGIRIYSWDGSLVRTIPVTGGAPLCFTAANDTHLAVGVKGVNQDLILRFKLGDM